jgi:probable lipoprotein NlpC
MTRFGVFPKAMVLVLLWSGFAHAPGLFAAAPYTARVSGDERGRVIAAAGEYRGIPYRYGGMDRRGLDCSGLVYLSFRDALGLQVPRTAADLYAWVEKVENGRIEPGDLVFFKTAGNGAVSHVGIYLGDGWFIHAASEGPKTGVIYSPLSEDYWRRTYAGAGRVFPPGAGPFDGPLDSPPGPRDGPSGGGSDGGGGSPGSSGRGIFLAGFALAPSWGFVEEYGAPIRGAAFQARIAVNLALGAFKLRPALELRPEYDGSLGIFRIPLTLSLGMDDGFRIFAGPALTLGTPALRSGGGERPYTGADTWLGVLGISAAPLSFNLGGGTLSLYGEAAWQFFVPGPSAATDWAADLSAGFRLFTGISYTWGL